MTAYDNICDDCGVDTGAINEYYMVNWGIWMRATRRYEPHYLCIGCLEARIGFKLQSCDFLPCPLMFGSQPRSARLRDRMMDGLLELPVQVSPDSQEPGEKAPRHADTAAGATSKDQQPDV